MFNSCNQDCNDVICSFMDVSSLSKLMRCSKDLGYESMSRLGDKYEKKTPKTGLMTVSRAFPPEQRSKLQKLLPGNGEHVLTNKCRICEKKFSIRRGDVRIMEEYGFIAHEACVNSKERVLISYGVTGFILSYMESLRVRNRVKGSTTNMVSIEFEIPGVFPKEYTLDGQNLDDAHESAAQAICDKFSIVLK